MPAPQYIGSVAHSLAGRRLEPHAPPAAAPPVAGGHTAASVHPSALSQANLQGHAVKCPNSARQSLSDALVEPGVNGIATRGPPRVWATRGAMPSSPAQRECPASQSPHLVMPAHSFRPNQARARLTGAHGWRVRRTERRAAALDPSAVRGWSSRLVGRPCLSGFRPVIGPVFWAAIQMA